MKNFLLLIVFQILGVTLINAQLSGTVYQDLPVDSTALNIYGFLNSNEIGVEGVTVTAFPSGETTTTASDGTYSLTATGDARIEFSNWPSYLEPSPEGDAGNCNVQFATAPATVSFGLHNPTDYSSTVNPSVVLSHFINGTGNGQTNFALFSTPMASTGLNADFTNNGNQGTGPVPSYDATIDQVGSVWGLAFQKNQQRLFAASFLKRHSGFAEGPGYVYILDYSSGTGTLADTFNLQGVTPANGGANIDLGSIDRTSSADYILNDDPSMRSIDLDAFGKVGKMSFGDAEMDQATNTLWLVNLYQNALISVDVSGNSASVPGPVNQYLISSMSPPSCTGGSLRPFALKFMNGKGYLGCVCDASISQNDTDLDAYVLSFDPNNMAAGFTTELTFNLEYLRESTDGMDYSFGYWTDTYNDGAGTIFTIDGNSVLYPQPMLSDIEFDKDGNMYLGIMDRMAHQIGYQNYRPLSGDNTIIKTVERGEVLKVCNNGGTFEVEGMTNCTTMNYNGTKNKNPMGNGEFFNDKGGDANEEASIGSLALLKGSNMLLSTMVDPHPEGINGADYWNTQGFVANNLTDGSIDNWYSGSYYTQTPGFGKAIGIGDIELLTEAAPVEVGDLVWNDANSNGIQDAGENGIAGVKVKLFDTFQIVLDSATTNVNGKYIFSNDAQQTSTSSHRYGISGLVPGGSYSIVIENVQGASKQAVLGTMTLSQNGIGEGVNATWNDSDGTIFGDAAGVSVLPSSITRSGSNNHDFDFGFGTAAVCPEICLPVDVVRN